MCHAETTHGPLRQRARRSRPGPATPESLYKHHPHGPRLTFETLSLQVRLTFGQRARRPRRRPAARESRAGVALQTVRLTFENLSLQVRLTFGDPFPECGEAGAPLLSQRAIVFKSKRQVQVQVVETLQLVPVPLLGNGSEHCAYVRSTARFGLVKNPNPAVVRRL